MTKSWLKAHPEWEDKPAPVECKVDDLGDGSYELSWSCTVAGTFPLDVVVDGRNPVQGSPVQLNVLAAEPSVPHFAVSGAGLTTATAGDHMEHDPARRAQPAQGP